MSGRVIHRGLEEALVSDDPIVRMIARAGASRWVEEMQAWVNSELERGEKPSHLMQAMMSMFVRTHSGLATQLVKRAHFRDVAEMFKSIVDEEYVRHAEMSLVFLLDKRAGR
ncbi:MULTISPECIES: hypothetical protein [unclassified Rhizobium]|uniref:hypothetical protein n=1 Tax=unclassified Rhizobium TaxID=2613769 RepID=UPI00162011FF|nr:MULTISPECIES: hypothetical protein [unclassified Rhizobium]MBB3386017.1 hypothetical protein [Rhizobium sp. BK098]MBB3617806.1 hypothetical protein [Rhizobium sp. BK609]MBB3683379.1 hypothetical protein [Rhizobium sp. BK612]